MSVTTPKRRVLAPALSLLAALSWTACSDARTPPARAQEQLRLAWPSSGPFAQELAAAYRRVSNLDVRIVQDANPIRAIEQGRADMTVTVADLAYFAYRSSPHLRSIAALDVVPVQLVARKEVDTVAELRGHSIAAPGPSRMVDLILDAAGAGGAIDYQPRATTGRFETPRGTFDAFVVVTYYPNSTVERALQQGGHLLSIDGEAVDRVQRVYPFIRRATIPPNTYPGQTAPVRTVGTNMLYVCRQDLGEEMVHTLADGLFRALPQLSERIRPLRFVNVEAAAAVPIPLHEGAARYYREREVQ